MSKINFRAAHFKYFQAMRNIRSKASFLKKKILKIRSLCIFHEALARKKRQLHSLSFEKAFEIK